MVGFVWYDIAYGMFCCVAGQHGALWYDIVSLASYGVGRSAIRYDAVNVALLVGVFILRFLNIHGL